MEYKSFHSSRNSISQRGVIVLKQKFISACAALLLIAGSAFAGAMPAQAAGSVAVNLHCTGNGDYAWNAVYIGGKSNTGYSVYAKTIRSSGGGSGGDFDWKYQGKMTTGPGGTGSTSTYYSYHQDVGTIQLSVKINGATDSITKTC